MAAVLLVAGMVAVWADHLFLRPSNWETTSTKLLSNAAIRTSTATYLADQVDARLGPEAESSPAADHTAIFNAVDAALSLQSVRSLWAQANRDAATAVVTIVDGPPEPVSATDGDVSLDLGPILRTAVVDADLPAPVTAAVPAELALTVVRPDQVHTVRTAGRAVRDLARWLVIVVPVLWLAAFAMASGWRRRTMAWIGITAAVAGALVLGARALLVTPVADAVSSNPLLRPIIAGSITTATTSLGRLAIGVGAVGLVVAVIAGLAGLTPGRPRYSG